MAQLFDCLIGTLADEDPSKSALLQTLGERLLDELGQAQLGGARDIIVSKAKDLLNAPVEQRKSKQILGDWVEWKAFIQLARLDLVEGKYESALKRSRHLADLAKVSLGSDYHPRLLEARELEADCLALLCEYHESAAVYKYLHDIRTALYGSTHDLTKRLQEKIRKQEVKL